MDEEYYSTKLIIFFTFCCFVLSLLLGIIFRVSFWTVIFRSILFAIMGLVASYIISKIWNTVMSGESTKKNVSNDSDQEIKVNMDNFNNDFQANIGDFDNSGQNTDTNSSIESPNALFQAKDYENSNQIEIDNSSNMSNSLGSEDTENNITQGELNKINQNAEANQEVNLLSGEKKNNSELESDKNKDTSKKKFEEQNEINLKHDETHRNKTSATKFNGDEFIDSFQTEEYPKVDSNSQSNPIDINVDISKYIKKTIANPSQDITSNEEEDGFSNLEYLDNSKYKIKRTGHEKFDKAVENTLNVYTKAPEQVNKAVASWVKNGNNSN